MGTPCPERPLTSLHVGAWAASLWRKANGVGLLLKAAYIDRMRHCVELWEPRSGASLIVRGDRRGAGVPQATQAWAIRSVLARSAV
jgi:hypothetical protein